MGQGIDKFFIIYYNMLISNNPKTGGREFFLVGRFGYGETVPRKNSKLRVLKPKLAPSFGVI